MTTSFSAFQANLCNISFLASLFTTIYYWANTIFFEQKYKFGLFGLLSINILLIIQLIDRWIESGHFPLSSLYESLLFLGWGISAIYIFIEYMTQNQIIGILVSPILTCLLGFTGFTLPPELQEMKPLVPALQSNWLFMHVSVMMLSYAGLLVGSLMSIAYVVIYISTSDKFILKQQKESPEKFFPANSLPLSENATQAFPVLAFRRESETKLSNELSFSANTPFPYPSDKTGLVEDQGRVSHLKDINVTNILNIFDNISYRTIGIGFCFLTLGILSGAVWANETWGSYWSWDPKETWALITWLTFAVYLHMRFLRGWVGIKPAWIASLGFVLIWVCYLGVNLLGKGLHSYGFFT